MTATIRAARRADLPAIYDLLESAFPEATRSLFVAHTEDDSTFRLRHGRVAVVHGQIAAYVRIFARRMLVRGVPVAGGGIGSVATAAGGRSGGLATALLRDAIEQMRREGMALSFLFTGIPGFYERVGFRIVREPQFTASRAEILAAATTPQFDVRPLAEADAAQVARLYTRAIAGSAGAIARTRRTSADALHWLDESASFVACEPGTDRVAGYLRSRCRTFGHQVLEAETLPGYQAAIAALLAAVARQPCACGDVVVAQAPSDHQLATALQTLPSTTDTTEVEHPMMVRVISLARLVEALLPGLRARAAGHPGPDFRLRLTSPDGDAATIAARGRSVWLNHGRPDFSLDAGSTLEALLGQRRASRAVRRRIDPAAARRLDALLPAAPLHFWNTDRI
jgi:predicted N-acetyltransferase YhbS